MADYDDESEEEDIVMQPTACFSTSCFKAKPRRCCSRVLLSVGKLSSSSALSVKSFTEQVCLPFRGTGRETLKIPLIRTVIRSIADSRKYNLSADDDNIFTSSHGLSAEEQKTLEDRPATEFEYRF